MILRDVQDDVSGCQVHADVISQRHEPLVAPNCLLLRRVAPRLRPRHNVKERVVRQSDVPLNVWEPVRRHVGLHAVERRHIERVDIAVPPRASVVGEASGGGGGLRAHEVAGEAVEAVVVDQLRQALRGDWSKLEIGPSRACVCESGHACCWADGEVVKLLNQYWITPDQPEYKLLKK